MKINSTKTKEMVICFCKNPDHVNAPTIKIDDNDTDKSGDNQSTWCNCVLRPNMECTVKLVYKDHTMDQQNVILIHRRSLYEG